MRKPKIVILTPKEIAKKLEQFREFDSVHGIERGSDGNVTSPEKLIGEKCYYVKKIAGKRTIVVPIDKTKCAIISKGRFLAIYDIELISLLCSSSITGRSNNGYQEILITKEAVLALDGIVPNIKEYYLPIFEKSGSDVSRRTNFHRDAYCLMTDGLPLGEGFVIHHNRTGKSLRTYNVRENLVKLTISEHASLHKKLSRSSGRA